MSESASTADGRTAVIAAALDLFASQGFEATTVDQIAHAAGISRSTFFRQFGGKDDVVFADHEVLLAELRAYLWQPHANPWDAVCEASLRAFRHFAADPGLARRRFTVVRQVPTLRDREIVTTFRYERLFTEYLRDALPTLDPLDSVGFAALVTATHNHVLRELLRGHKRVPVAVLRRALDRIQERFGVGSAAVPAADDVVVAVFPRRMPTAELTRRLQARLDRPGGTRCREWRYRVPPSSLTGDRTTTGRDGVDDRNEMSDDAALPGERISQYEVADRLDTDYDAVFADVPAADREVWDRAKAFVDEVGDRMTTAWDTAEYPLDLVHRMGELDLFTDGIRHPALSPSSPLAAGLVNMEVSRGDGSLGTVIAVQGGLALRTLALFGSEDQQARLLQPLAHGEVLGAFALTEPDHGSDSVSLETVARLDASGEWVLRGAKKWIGNGASGGVTFVWARVDADGDPDHGRVRCFLVPQETPGYRGEVIVGKTSLRGIHQAHIRLEDVRLPADAVLPGTHSFKDASTVLYATRTGVAWSALGHATACYEASLTYAGARLQFGKPLARFQMVQERLTQMLADLTAMQLYCRRLAGLESSGMLRPTQASLAKYHNTRAARRIAAVARDLLGGNGILLENRVMMHLADIEAIHTYEGTESVQALLIGRDITGVSAFA